MLVSKQARNWSTPFPPYNLPPALHSFFIIVDYDAGAFTISLSGEDISSGNIRTMATLPSKPAHMVVLLKIIAGRPTNKEIT
jgi:hypothetical protein